MRAFLSVCESGVCVYIISGSMDEASMNVLGQVYMWVYGSVSDEWE